VWQNIKVPSDVIANDAEAIEQILTRITERKPHLASFIKVTRDQKNQITKCIFLTGQNVLDEEYMLQDLSLLATKADTVQERVVDDLCEDCRHKPHTKYCQVCLLQ
jgi:hypothetical protein